MKKTKGTIMGEKIRSQTNHLFHPKNTLTAVPVLAEPLKPDPLHTTEGHKMLSGEARESTQPGPLMATDSRGGSQKPSTATAADWREACERAQRATDYATMFPGSNSCASQQVYQSPLWQWENRVKPFDGRGK